MRLVFLVLSLIQIVAAEDNSVLVTVKLVKRQQSADALPYSITFPASCSACVAVHDASFERQNEREIILAMRLPRSTASDVQVEAQGSAIQRVLLETTDLPFDRTAKGIKFVIPPQIADRVNSGEFQTHLYWRGVELRLEHADPLRRAGDYAQGEFPMLQRKAASNLEFGLLEAIRELGLDAYIDDQNLGKLYLMGFDTNYPHGHHDFPPHFHLALWLANYRATGSLIPHLYLTPQGLIANSLVGIYGWPAQPSNFEYKADNPFTPVDMLGRPVYSLTITQEGWLDLTRFDGLRCTLRPVGEGFDSGTKVTCPHFPTVSIYVDDDVRSGQIRESIDGKIAAVFHYDPDTGALEQR